MAFNTRLVGDNMCRLLKINIIKIFDNRVITKIRGIIYLELRKKKFKKEQHQRKNMSL